MKLTAEETAQHSSASFRFIRPMLLLAVWAAILLFWQLGTYTILETIPDEGWYAEVSREMVQRGDYLTLRYLGDVFLEKPPLFYWLQAGFMHVFGMNEWAIRLPSAISSLLLILFVYYFTARMLNPRTGFLAGVLLTTMLYTVIFGHIGWIDALLTLSNTVALAFLYASFESKSHASRYFYAASIAVGVSFLTKGPVGLFFPLAIGGLYLLLTKQLFKFRTLPLGRGVILFLGIALPWYLCMFWVHGWEFYDLYIIEHHVARINSGDPWVAPSAVPSVWVYLGATLLCTLPWLPLVLIALGSALRKGQNLLQEDERLVLFLLIWSLFIPLIFGPTKGRYFHYALPASPAWAMLTAQYLLARSARSTRVWQFKAFAVSIFLTALAFFLFGILRLTEFDGMTWRWSIGIVFFVGGACALVAFFKKQYLASMMSMAVVWSLGTLMFLQGPLLKSQTARPYAKIARQASEFVGPEGVVLCYRASKQVQSMDEFVMQPQSMAFYVSPLLRVSYDAEEVVRMMNGHETVCLILSAKDYRQHLAHLDAEVVDVYNIYVFPLFTWRPDDFDTRGKPVLKADLDQVIADFPQLKLHPHARRSVSSSSTDETAVPDNRLLLLTNGK